MSVDARPYYEASLRLLKHVESRQPTNRRFGGEADALWAQFRGGLNTADRIDTLLRDADAQWPGAFGARTVFQLPGVAEDDAFGSAWSPLDGIEAEELWRSVASVAVASAEEALSALAACWALKLSPLELPSIHPAQMVVVTGPSAIASLIAHFSAAPELSWTDQVTVVATPPAHRQLAAAAGAILAVNRATNLIDHHGTLEGKRTQPLLVASADASAEDRARADELVG